MRTSRGSIVIAIATISIIGAGCTKKVASAPPPPPPVQQAAAERVTPSTPPVRTVNNSTPATAPTAPAPRYPSAQTRARIDQLLARIEDAYFDYDKHNLRPDAVNALQADSAELRDILKDYPDYKLTIEGHCDERGSAEYNMALGQERADAAKDYLVQVGIPADQLHTISYGKEKPVCQEQDEACWQKNRRVHIVALAQGQ